jgi:hypothetical protein
MFSTGADGESAIHHDPGPVSDPNLIKLTGAAVFVTDLFLALVFLPDENCCIIPQNANRLLAELG